MAALSDLDSILIVRVWRDADSASGLRGRVVEVIDSPEAERVIATAADPETLSGVVRAWLETLTPH